MKSMQSGFTLIELVIVIVILGVLAALAVPRFVNLQDDAQQAAVDANAKTITSAMNINYAACAMKNFNVAGDCKLVNSCDDVSDILNAALATGYTPATTAIAGTANGDTQTCSLTGPTGTSAGSYIAIRTGPNGP